MFNEFRNKIFCGHALEVLKTIGGYGSKTAEHVKLSQSSGIRNKTWTEKQTIGWKPSCKCKADAVSALVVDPFMGRSTTAVSAQRLNRDYVGIEIKPEYVEMAEKRLKQEVLF